MAMVLASREVLRQLRLTLVAFALCFQGPASRLGAANALDPPQEDTASSVDALTHELAGAYALEIETAMNVDSPVFREALMKAFAESIGVRVESVLGFIINRLDQPMPNTPAGSLIIGVGFEVAAGSQKREREIQQRLNNIEGPSSRVRSCLVDILDRHGVSLLAVEVAHRITPVAQLTFLTTSAAPYEDLMHAPPSEESSGDRSFSSTFVMISCMLVGFCIWMHCRSRRPRLRPDSGKTAAAFSEGSTSHELSPKGDHATHSDSDVGTLSGHPSSQVDDATLHLLGNDGDGL
jgi:hypothetical protein